MQIGVETSKAVDQRRVFVIDDDDITRTVLQFMLQDEIETHEMATLEEAYDKGVGWLKPDLVLVGVSFVKARGEALVGELKIKFPGVQILVICQKEDETVAVSALKAGANGAVLKPLTLEAVRSKVDTVLGRGGAAAMVQLGGLK
ncbi:response regulator [Roseibium litorale]|uniref:Response regulator n=1 Tax=Roseibium litorale TaxID=2803841 RepID=A0ABR9CRP8_9HYPH|nr:response regulator [Roseibium litorale]MBD8893324.1 response regulator [Roseibium litorale]